MMALRAGTTAEGTNWRTRPMSPDVAARYACIHRGGVVPCANAAETCKPPENPLGWGPLEWIRREGGKPYSPAAPKGAVKSALPPDVGAGFAEICARAARRLAGLEPWPEIIDPPTPRLSKIARGMVDAGVTRAYREFCAAVIAAGGQLAMPLGVTRRPAARRVGAALRARALKAWATRRRTGRASDSARKAWATRRARAA